MKVATVLRRLVVDRVSRRFDVAVLDEELAEGVFIRVPRQLADVARRLNYRKRHEAIVVSSSDDLAATGRLGPLVSPGNALPAAWREELRIVVIDVTAIRDESLPPVLDQVARAQVMTGAFKPLFATSSTDFGVFDRHGYSFEYVQGEGTYAAGRLPEPWTVYRFERLVSLADTFQPVAVIVAVVGVDLVEQLRLLVHGADR